MNDELLRKYVLLKRHFSHESRFVHYDINLKNVLLDFVSSSEIEIARRKMFGCKVHKYNISVQNAFMIYMTFNKYEEFRDAENIIRGTRFKRFMLDISDFGKTFLRDYEDFQINGDFDSLKSLGYNKKIHPLSFHYILKLKFSKNTIKLLKESTVYFDILYRNRQLSKIFHFSEMKIQNIIKDLDG